MKQCSKDESGCRVYPLPEEDRPEITKTENKRVKGVTNCSICNIKMHPIMEINIKDKDNYICLDCRNPNKDILRA